MLFKIDIYSMGKIFLYDLLKLYFGDKDFSNLETLITNP